MRGTTVSKSRRRQGSNWGRFMLFGVAITTAVLVILAQLQQVQALGSATVEALAKVKSFQSCRVAQLWDASHCCKNTWRLEIAPTQTKSAYADSIEPAEAGFVCVAPDFQSVGDLLHYPTVGILPTTGYSENQEFLLAATELLSSSLPSPQVHPLPATLSQWQDTKGTGDYFSEIKLTPVGYLVWSQFPIKIYVEQPKNPAESSASVQRFQQWVEAVLQAVREWNVYLPLEVIAQREGADILILHERPSLRASFDRETGKFSIPRARSAETRYEFYLHQAANASEKLLSQRFTIQLSPHQTVDYTLATARHELGHALGIWGHSPSESDTMYFSQVRNPPQISVRDINTLKRIYEQPTRLGWPLASQSGDGK